jgi:arylsulfatase A-like enzyme
MKCVGSWLLVGIQIVLVGACSPQPQHDHRPNILLIVADDLGYADLGVFGSDIRTPNIDRLGREGVIFTQFHTSPICAPTRAMLLTGNNNHVAGMGSQFVPPTMANVPGYETHLSDRVAPMPYLLQEAGYRTYITGKWHLGTAPEHGPAAAGFERSFTLLHGAGSHFSSTGFFDGGSLYREGEAEVPYPEGRYSTELFTERLLEFIDSGRNSGRPFFAFAAYTSPHWPLQVPDEDLNLYAGRYEQGYDRLREERFESLKAAGIIPPHSALPPRNDAIAPWDELTAEERRRESRKMELYAAMVENLDRHVGTLIEYLEANGLYENTLIVFMSDNGAAAEDFFHVGPFVDYIREHYDNSYENMGRPTSWVSYGPQWAEAGSAPFSRFKGFTRQGGIQAPMIVSGAGVVRRGEIDHSYLTVMDLAPTFLELAGARYPTDGSVRPMLGASMADLLQGRADRVHGDDYVTVLHHAGRAFLRQGRWKLVNLDPPFQLEDLELFDLEADPGETTNLALDEPEVFARMIELWRTTRNELGIVLENDPR